MVIRLRVTQSCCLCPHRAAAMHRPPLSQSRGGGGRSSCESSRSPEPSSLGDIPGCASGKASGLPALPAFEPRRPSSSSRSSSRSTPSSSLGAGLHHPPVYREGMVFYPTTGGPSAGQAGLPHYYVLLTRRTYTGKKVGRWRVEWRWSGVTRPVHERKPPPAGPPPLARPPRHHHHYH
jgi:hypothetical protein